MPLEVEWVADEADFAKLGPRWEALLPADAQPFDCFDWYAAWWRAFGGGRELAVCSVRDGDELAGILPLQVEGARMAALVNGHSGTFRPLARDPESMQELVGAAFGRRPRELALRLLPANGTTLPLLEEAARSASLRPLVEPGYASPVVDTSGDFDAWRKAGNTSWKKGLARYRRKLQRDHGAELEIVAAPERLDERLEEGFLLEQSGWKGSGGTAILSAPETELFYREIARRFHGRGELRLSRVAVGGDAIAFNFCIQMGNRLFGLKTGYDERWRKLAPGLVMQLAVIERCFELGLDAYEMLGETSEWKAKVATGSREHADLRAFPRGPLGSAGYGYRAHLRPMLRDSYRRLRTRAG